MRISDWSSDVCSSDLLEIRGLVAAIGRAAVAGIAAADLDDVPDGARLLDAHGEQRRYRCDAVFVHQRADGRLVLLDMPHHRLGLALQPAVEIRGIVGEWRRRADAVQKIGREAGRESVGHYV